MLLKTVFKIAQKARVLNFYMAYRTKTGHWIDIYADTMQNAQAAYKELADADAAGQLIPGPVGSREGATMLTIPFYEGAEAFKAGVKDNPYERGDVNADMSWVDGWRAAEAAAKA